MFTRTNFDKREKMILVQIVHGTDGGRLLEGLLEKDSTKNMARSVIWTEIQALFCQVGQIYGEKFLFYFLSVLRSRNYLFLAPAPTLTIISAPAPAPATAIYWHFKLF